MYSSDRTVGDALAGFVFGGFFFIKGLGLWRDKRDIQNKPLSKVSGVAMGDAELSGEVKAEKLMKSRFSGIDCVYCAYSVEMPERNGWRRVDHGQTTSIFYLDDGTGQILVDPEAATFYGPQTYQKVLSGSELLLEPGIAAWVDERRQASFLGELTGSGRHRFTEYTVIPSQIIFVEGAVSTVRHSVNGAVREEMIVGRRASGHFVLSAFSEEKLLSDFAWKAPLQIFGGGALLLGCLWYLVERFQLERLLK